LKFYRWHQHKPVPSQLLPNWRTAVSGPTALTSWLLLGVLAGCSHMPPQSPPPTPTLTPTPAPSATIAPPPDYPSATPALAEQPTRPFNTETLYSLLAAELAGSRQNYDLALSNYAQQARETRDPPIAARATLLARSMGDTDTALETSRIWLASAPNNLDALTNTALAQMEAGQLLQAFELSRQLLEQGSEPLFQMIAARAQHLPEAEHQALLARYQELLSTHKRNQQLLVGTGLLLEQEERYTQALESARAALALERNSLPAAILEANLLHQLKRDREAIAKMEPLVALHPDNYLLRQQFARLLIPSDLARAQQEFQQLTQQLPNNGDIWLSLGIIALQREDQASARQAFETLIDLSQHLDTAHFYLGQLLEEQGELTQAAMHYVQIHSGNNLFAAKLRLLDILVRSGDFASADQQLNKLIEAHPEQAGGFYLLYIEVLGQHQLRDRVIATLDQGIARLPEDERLRFARAMMNQARGQLQASEADLRQILAANPQNAQALNALGYLLADSDQHLEEAQQLIDRALKLTPEDPAVLDSMGWVEFRRGHLARALDYLARAYNLSADAEIGAHLGEALWRAGRQDEALNIWRACHKRAPTSKVLRETLTRLKVEL